MSQSVAKALDIIEALGKSESGYNLVELSNKVGFPHSTVHRLLNTLKKKGFVVQETPSGTYYLSGKFLRLQTTIYTKQSLILTTIPILNRLAQALPCHAHLGMLDDDRVIYIESRRYNPFGSEYLPSGRTAPVHSTALGKVMTAFLPQDDRKCLLARLSLDPVTSYTVTNLEQLTQQLEDVRRQGYAFENQESRVDGGCVAAPIFNHTGAVIAAISTFWWFSQKPSDSFAEFAELVVAGAQEISRTLGWEQK